MEVEVLEARLRSRDPVLQVQHNLVRGDRVTLAPETGKAWCELGWVRDLSGVVPTGVPVRGVPTTLTIHNVLHGVKDSYNA